MGPDGIEIEVERYIRDKDLYSEYVKEKFDKEAAASPHPLGCV